MPYVVLPGLLAGLRVQEAADRTRCQLLVGTADQQTLDVVRPDVSVFRAQLADVIADAELREDRAPEILMQTQGVNAFFATVLPITAARTPATLQLLGIANQAAIFVEMQMKHVFACARPHEYSPQVQPMIATPGHGTYPMGHGCEAQVTARLLAALTQSASVDDPAWHSMRHQLDTLAERIAENRIVSGVHFRVDQWAGKALGDALAEYVMAFSNEASSPTLPVRVYDPAGGASEAVTGTPVAVTLPAADLRREMCLIWKRARAEWRWLHNDPLPTP